MPHSTPFYVTSSVVESSNSLYPVISTEVEKSHISQFHFGRKDVNISV